MTTEVHHDELVENTTKDADTTADQYCHIADGSSLRFYCGLLYEGDLWCKSYNGEAICPSCGLPTCPTCAVMASLNDRLE